MKSIRGFMLPAALALLLAACGGGGEAPVVVAADPLAELPASASQSAAALASYVGTLASLPADMREPVSLDNFNPLKSEDTEPEPVGGV
jgi:hypothetical protein